MKSWIKNRLSEFLDSRGIKKSYLVTKLGKQPRDVRDWCSGDAGLSIETLATIVEVTKMTPNELYLVVTGKSWKESDDVNEAARRIAKVLTDGTKKPEKAFDDELIQHVGYDAAQCGREK